MFRSHILRIRKNRLSNILSILLLVLPSFEIIQYYIEQYQNVKLGGVFRIPKPVYAVFQSAELTQGLFHSLFFGFYLYFFF